MKIQSYYVETIFIHEWFDNVNKFEFKGLPQKADFYSGLSQKQISDKDYEHATNVYKNMN